MEKCRIICGHEQAIIEADDAYYVACTDGEGDICEDCMSKERSVRCMDGNPPEDEAEADRISSIADYWFAGTMDELEALLK